MSKKENIEKHMSNLARQESQTPPSFVWKEIEQHLDGGDSEQLVWWKIVLPVLLLVAPLYFLFFFGSESSQNISSNTVTPAETLIGLTEKAEISSILSNEDLNTQEVDASSESMKSTKGLDSVGQTNRNIIGQSSAKNDGVANLTLEDNVWIVAESYDQEKEPKNNSELSTHSSSNENLKQNAIGMVREKLTTSDFQRTTANSSISLDEKVNTNAIANKNDEEANTEKPDFTIVSLPFLEQKIVNKPIIPVLSLPLLPAVDNRNVNKEEQSLWFLDLNGFVGGHLVNFDSDSGLQSTFREEAETARFAWGGDIHLGCSISENFYITGGISYRQLKNRFDYRYNSTVDSYIPDSISLIESIFTTDTLFISRGETTHTFVDASSLIGYQKEYAKFILGAELGFGFNFYASEQGKVYLGAREISRLEDLSYAKSRVGFSLLVNASLGYQLSHKWTIMLKPGIRYQLANSYNTTSPYEKNFSLLGTSAGIRYRF